MNTRVLKLTVWMLLFSLLDACSSTQVHPEANATSSNYQATSTVAIASTLTSNATQMGLKSWRDAGYLGKGATVAVLDTGMPVWDIHDRNIPLSANVRYDADFTKDQIVKNSDTSIYNANHGDDMSQVIGSAIYGAAPNANLLNGVIADTQGYSNRVSSVKGIEWAVNNQADVINLSFDYIAQNSSGQLFSALLSYTGSVTSNIESELNNIKNKVVTSQVAIVHSAGNDSKSVSSVLNNAAGYQDWVKSNAKNNILIVGATYDNKNLASFSNYAGTDTDVQSRFVVAPAKSEVTNGYSTLYTVGTSGAAANVSGALAVMKSRWQSLTGVQLEQIILDTANRSFSGYDVTKFGQGIVDLNAAFSPVGKTSVPVSSTSSSVSSVSLSSSVVALPAGFKSISASTAFLDSYGRDFTLKYQTPVQTYQSGLDKTVQAYVSAPQNYQQQLGSHLKLGFSMNNGVVSKDRQDAGLWFLGMASDYQQHLNNSVLGQVSLSSHTGSMHFGMSATTPNPSASSFQATSKPVEPTVQGMKAHLGFKNVSVMPYWLGVNNTSAFVGAQAESLAGVQTEYHFGGWLAGLDWSQQNQPGQALIQNYNIDSQRYYAGYRGDLNSDLRFGLLGFWQTDNALIGYQHPQSVGDGSLRYVTDNLRSQRVKSGVSAAVSIGHLQAAVLSSNFDHQFFVGFKQSFH
ncbi:S8 family peptidase [Hydrogenovibrio kuenenii]|uniref:S8 family peptidase n=1 Tax=Hydrogenovibrio kuenenii TaxID=63658 RepID=UPI0004657A00|nr:S8 family serine peptidase [Hydrogenovibrio kuenenii]